MVQRITSTTLLLLSSWLIGSGYSLSTRSSDDATILQTAQAAFPDNYSDCKFKPDSACKLDGYTTYDCIDGICISYTPAITRHTYNTNTGEDDYYTDPAVYGPYCWYDCDGAGEVSEGVCGGAFAISGDSLESASCA